MIKFRCLNCGQKLAVADDGVGAVVSCTNCAERIIVPPYSITENFASWSGRSSGTFVAGGLESIRPPNESAGNAGPLRAALIPHLARMMMNRLVQALFAQRESLIDTQSEATKRMFELEERITRAQVNVQGRFAAYENRIGELEKLLAAKEEENRELMRQNFQLAKRALEAENTPQPASVSLRDAGFLLRA